MKAIKMHWPDRCILRPQQGTQKGPKKAQNIVRKVSEAIPDRFSWALWSPFNHVCALPKSFCPSNHNKGSKKARKTPNPVVDISQKLMGRFSRFKCHMKWKPFGHRCEVAWLFYPLTQQAPQPPLPPKKPNILPRNFSRDYYWSFCICAQPLRDDVAMQRRLSLAACIHKMIPRLPHLI